MICLSFFKEISIVIFVIKHPIFCHNSELQHGLVLPSPEGHRNNVVRVAPSSISRSPCSHQALSSSSPASRRQALRVANIASSSPKSHHRSCLPITDPFVYVPQAILSMPSSSPLSSSHASSSPLVVASLFVASLFTTVFQRALIPVLLASVATRVVMVCTCGGHVSATWLRALHLVGPACGQLASVDTRVHFHRPVSSFCALGPPWSRG